AGRRRRLDDADLSLGLHHAGGGGPSAAGAAASGMAHPSPRRDSEITECRRGISAAAALLGAVAGCAQPEGLASGIRSSGRGTARAAVRLLRDGGDLWPRG